MTLSEILLDSYRRCNFASSPDGTVTTRFKAFINEAQRQLLTMPGMERLRRSTLTFASVASQSQYAMPPIVARVLAMTDSTNDITLHERSWTWYRATEPDPSSITGQAEVYVPYGLSAVHTQPSNASKVYVDSTVAGDTNTAYVEGFRTGGYPFSWSGLMTGTTAVQVGSYTDIIEVTKFYLSAVAVGDVTLHEDAEGGTQLGKIPIGLSSSLFWTVALWPTPSAVLTYTIDCERTVPDMTNSNDTPLLPADFHYLLAVGCRMKEYEKQDDTRYAVASREWNKGITDLKWWLACQPTAIVTRNEPSRPSRLGAWYPAGT